MPLTRSKYDRVLLWLRRSTVPYLSVIVAFLATSRLIPYFYRGDFTVLGQPPAILVVLIGALPAAVLWFICERSPNQSKVVQILLLAAGLLWLSVFILTLFHGDAFNYGVWLAPAVIVAIALKTPSSNEAWRAVLVLAWILAGALAVAWLGELTGVLDPYPTPPGLHQWESSNYWLPLDGLFGFEGRWPGPFSHNTRAGFAAAFVVVVGVADRGLSRIILGSIGLLALAFIFVRASLLAAFAGVSVLLMFRVFAQLSSRGRALGILIVASFGAGLTYALYASGGGATGRFGVWEESMTLLQRAPFVGIGVSGFADASNPIAIYGDALNALLTQLTLFGLVGTVFLLAMLVVLMWLSFRAAWQGHSRSLALLTTYLVVSFTDVHNDWLHPSIHFLLLLLVGLDAAQCTDRHLQGGLENGERARVQRTSPSSHGFSDEYE